MDCGGIELPHPWIPIPFHLIEVNHLSFCLPRILLLLLLLTFSPVIVISGSNEELNHSLWIGNIDYFDGKESKFGSVFIKLYGSMEMVCGIFNWDTEQGLIG